MTEVPTDMEGAEVPSSQEFAPGGSGNMVGWMVGVGVILAIVVVMLVVSADFRHRVALHTGISNGGPDPYYNFWSGFGSDLGEVTLISAVTIGVYTGVRKVNCHTKGCWRVSHHQLEGTPYILGRHHHPGIPTRGASHEHILAQHRRHQREKTPASHSETP